MPFSASDEAAASFFAASAPVDGSILVCFQSRGSKKRGKTSGNSRRGGEKTHTFRPLESRRKKKKMKLHFFFSSRGDGSCRQKSFSIEFSKL